MAVDISSLTPAEIAALSAKVIAGLTADEWALFTTEQIAALTTAQAAAIPTRGIAALSAEQLGAFETAAAADTGDQRAQRGGGAAPATDDLAEVVGMHMHLDRAPAAVGHHVDTDILGVIHDAADQMLYGVDDD